MVHVAATGVTVPSRTAVNWIVGDAPRPLTTSVEPAGETMISTVPASAGGWTSPASGSFGGGPPASGVEVVELVGAGENSEPPDAPPHAAAQTVTSGEHE